MFETTLRQMLTMFAFILVGYGLRKGKILPEESGVTLARLETYLFVPALTLSSQISFCTVENFRQGSSLILYGAVIIAAGVLLAVPLSRLFVRRADTPEEAYQRSIYRYGLIFANYGFVGVFLFEGEMYFKYQLFCFVVGILCSSYGLYLLIPKEKNAGLLQNIKRSFLAPPMISLVVGMTFGLLNLGPYVPPFLMTAFKNAGACQGPVAMVLAGFVIAGFPLREILVNKKVYVATFLRLIAIPAAVLTVLHFLGTPKEIMMLALVCIGGPLGLNTIVYPETYGGDVKTGASMASISHTLCVVTIPLMYWLFIEMW